MFQRYFAHFTTNKKLNNKTDNIFELETVENLTRSIRRYSVVFTIRYCSKIWYCLHIRYNYMTLTVDAVISYWTNDMALTDDVALTDNVVGCNWTEILMWQYFIRMKCLYGVNWWYAPANQNLPRIAILSIQIVFI